MSIGPALYLGQVGSTGRSTGPHSHKEVLDLRTGKRIPLSQARTDLGQNIQFKLPGSQDWQQLYSQTSPGQFQLNPAAPLTSPKGSRIHPVTGQQAYHYGEDYGLPQGTDLRFLGSGSVESIPDYGNAGNVARLKTGDNRYQLDVFHLSKLPGTAKVEGQATGEKLNTPDENTTLLLKELISALQPKEETFQDQLIARALGRRQEMQNQIQSLIQLPQSSYLDPVKAMEMFS